MKRQNIGLRPETYQDLDEWRSPGQSFDGAVRELLQKQKVEVEVEQ